MKKKIPFSLMKLINVLLVGVPYVVVWFLYYEPRTLTVRSKQVSFLMLAGYLMLFFWMGGKLDGFGVSVKRIGELIFGQIIAVGVTDVIAAVVIWMLSVHFPNMIPGIMCFGVQVIVIVLVCYVSHQLFFKTHPPKKAVIIYDVRQGMEELISSYGLEKRYDVQASYAVEEVIGREGSDVNESLKEKLSGMEEVFMCGVHTHDRNIILKYCIYNGIRVLMIPRMGDMIMSAAERIHMFHLPFLRVARYNPPKEFVITKRVFDIFVSGISLLLLSPLMGIVALLIRTDGGPALYKQVRLTKDRREFKILKFRSMCVDAEKYSGAVWSAGENDPRITKVGRIIRACRLDELPQLWNIFVGDMSIVGPRPERPELAAEFEKEMPEFALRLQCKAGLTGYAQVYGKYNTTPYDKALMDLMYIAHPSMLEDLTIMLETVKILFSKESTEGVGAADAELRYEVRNKE